MTITTAPHLSDQDVAAITQLEEESVAAALAGDWDKFLETWDDDSVMMPPGAPTVSGKADAKAFLNEFPHITAFTSKADDIEFFCQFDGYSLEVPDIVGPVVQREGHPRQYHPRSYFVECGDHRAEVVSRHFHGNASQAIVASKFEPLKF